MGFEILYFRTKVSQISKPRGRHTQDVFTNVPRSQTVTVITIVTGPLLLRILAGFMPASRCWNYEMRSLVKDLDGAFGEPMTFYDSIELACGLTTHQLRTVVAGPSRRNVNQCWSSVVISAKHFL